MIPQRNISLLSNRLARASGRRIREDVLERDYCLAWLLAVLSESDLRPVLGFKGGTALKRCYFAAYRFSEDLDFTLLDQSRSRISATAWKPYIGECMRVRASRLRLIEKIDRATPIVTRST
jgi:hypothetical protein